MTNSKENQKQPKSYQKKCENIENDPTILQRDPRDFLKTLKTSEPSLRLGSEL